MRYLDEWAEGRPQVLVIIAQQIAVGAEAFFDFLMSVESGGRINDTSSLPCSLEDWLSLYKNHRRIQRSLGEILKKMGKMEETSNEFEAFLMGILRCMRMIELEKLRKEMGKLDPAEQREVIESGQKDVKERYNLHVDEVGDMTGIIDEELGKALREILQNPEMVFFLRVWMPCWFCFQEPATRLFRRARVGDKDSLEKLLEIDRLVLNDSQVRRHFQEPVLGKQSNAMMNALPEVKQSFAGLISYLFLRLEDELTESDIRGLFDAVAAEQGRGRGESDFPESREELTEIIERERAFWQSLDKG